MNILLIVHRFHPNLFYPVKSLIDHGHQVQLLVPKVDIYENLIEDYSYTKPIWISDKELNIGKIASLLKQLNPDLIIQRHFLKKWKLFSIVARIKGIKCITYDQSPQIGHSFIKQNSRPIRRLLRGEPLRKFTPVLHKGVPGKYTEPFSTYIPFPIEPIIKNVSEKQFCPNETIRFLCVGKLGQRRKNHLQLITALEIINSNCSLTIVGAGPGFYNTDKEYYDELKRKCDNSIIKGGVKILMDLSYKKNLNLYKEHDILVFPSEKEAHGQAILEGLAAGCPVIATDDCGASGYIKDGYNGLIYEKNNLKELIEKISFFIQNPEKIVEFSRNAIELILNNHSASSFSQSIGKLIKSANNGRKN